VFLESCERFTGSNAVRHWVPESESGYTKRAWATLEVGTLNLKEFWMWKSVKFW